MPLAKAAAKATRKPTRIKVAASAFTRMKGNHDGIRRFEGPANGIMLAPKAMRKAITNSIIDAILRCPPVSAPKIRRIKLISASPQAVLEKRGANSGNPESVKSIIALQSNWSTSTEIDSVKLFRKRK